MPELTEQEVLDILGAIHAQISQLAIHRYEQSKLVSKNEQDIQQYPCLIDRFTERIRICESKITEDTEKLRRLFALRDKFKSMLNKEVSIHVDP